MVVPKEVGYHQNDGKKIEISKIPNYLKLLNNKTRNMLYGFLIIIGCQLVGEVFVGTTGIPIPGAVMGMIFLFIGLYLKGNVPEELNIVGNSLIKYIGLLFVPAGAGISMHLSMITKEWNVILIASVSSTILTLLACGLLFQIFNKEN
ncbi:MAG: CidA/LrgA family protein [Nitrosomonadaceae bacterium]